MSTKCKYCEETFKGRADRKFCSDQCRALYNNDQKKVTDKAVYFINGVLRKNRNILKKLNPAGKTVIPKEYLELQGFDFRFYTHIYKAANGGVYYFVYEFGYMPIINHSKVSIVNWQDYMKKKIPDSFNLIPIIR